MAEFRAEDIYKIAKRHNNKRRAYLLINSLQGKHIPASPAKSLEMAQKLGEKLRGLKGKTMIVAFAESAVAIGAVAAEVIGEDVFFITTTREPLTDVHCIEFLEEHSHAREQSLVAERLEEFFAKSDNIVFLDDELSTGKTFCNIIQKLRERYPILNRKKLVAAVLLNRISDDNSQKLKNAGIYEEFLWKMENDNYDQYINDIVTIAATRPKFLKDAANFERIRVDTTKLNPRIGFKIGEYALQCREISEKIINDYKGVIENSKNILTLGTEECMYPALILGAAIEENFSGVNVFSQGTTRSPIGISDAPDYPIRAGFKIPSFYEESRTTYIYNTKKYDAVFVATDAPNPSKTALMGLASVFNDAGHLFLIY